MDNVEKGGIWRPESPFPTRETLKEGFTPKVIPKCGVARVRLLPLASGLLPNSVGQLGDLVIDRPAFSHELANLAIGMHNSGVVAAAKCLANLW